MPLDIARNLRTSPLVPMRGGRTQTGPSFSLKAPVSVAERADASWAAMRKIVGSRLKALEMLGGICGR